MTPQELIDRAADKGVAVLSITDHDTVDAYRTGPLEHDSLRVVPGIEFSTQWQSINIHVLGLNVDPHCDAIYAGTEFQTRARRERAQRIGENLAKLGIEGAWEGAQERSPGGYIGRPHFARHLVETGTVKDTQTAFKKYLGAGKAGDVRQHWADLPQIVQWIRDARGVPVLAHPLKYKITRTKLKRLLDDFIEVGGLGMEVVSGQQEAPQTASLGLLCAQKGLLASCGSDFHLPGKYRGELGVFSPLPDNVIPVWGRF